MSTKISILNERDIERLLKPRLEKVNLEVLGLKKNIKMLMEEIECLKNFEFKGGKNR